MGAILITSGRLRGRRVHTPEGSRTRPLLTRLRKSLADILRPRLAGARVLDLFGGSGAIAFELLSNGAERAVVVELAPTTAELIKANAAMLGVSASVAVSCGDAIAVLQILGRQRNSFDIIIIAPPYGLSLQQKALTALPPGILEPGGVIVVQREDREEQAPAPAGLSLMRTRSYGRTLFDFYEPSARAAQSI